MNSPEERIMELNHDTAEAEARSVSKMYGGRLSMMAGSIWFASGTFATDCLLHISGKAEHMSTTEQVLAIAAGGLAGAIAVLRKGYQNDGRNLFEVVQWRQERKKAVDLGRQADELTSWVEGPGELEAGDIAIVDQFRAQLEAGPEAPGV